MRIIVAGSRGFDNYDFLKKSINNLIKDIKKDTLIIVSGGARGVDTLAEIYAKEYNIENKIFPAKWNVYGKMAGMIRNAEMLKFIQEDNENMLVAFWDGKSKGTANMIERAKNANIKTKIYETD